MIEINVSQHERFTETMQIFNVSVPSPIRVERLKEKLPASDTLSEVAFYGTKWQQMAVSGTEWHYRFYESLSCFFWQWH